MSFIEVENVTKEYKIFRRPKGIIHSIRSVFYRQYEIKTAVKNISFRIDKGELVGYIGANGAGKSTTIKMLTGILQPTSGRITVDDRVPYLHRKENAMRIGVVFGQRSQLYWNLPMEETFELYRKIYKVDKQTFKSNVEFYTELLDMKDFLRTPVRQLSLGQRMRAELAVSLLHDPDILYLDEPTIGLDVWVKQKIRQFILDVNRQKQITMILTTHDMDDIEQVCGRIIVIDKGEILFDGSPEQFKQRFGDAHLVVVEFDRNNITIDDPRVNIIQVEDRRLWVQFRKNEISLAELVIVLSRCGNITDLQVREPKIEDAVRKIYAREK